MKWKRAPIVYPAMYDSDDGRFRVTWTYTRKRLRMTYSRVQLVDSATGEVFEGFRSVRDAKASAALISRGARADALGERLTLV